MCVYLSWQTKLWSAHFSDTDPRVFTNINLKCQTISGRWYYCNPHFIETVGKISE